MGKCFMHIHIHDNFTKTGLERGWKTILKKRNKLSNTAITVVTLWKFVSEMSTCKVMLLQAFLAIICSRIIFSGSDAYVSIPIVHAFNKVRTSTVQRQSKWDRWQSTVLTQNAKNEVPVGIIKNKIECGIFSRKMTKIIRAPLESTLICYISRRNRTVEVSSEGFHLHLERITSRARGGTVLRLRAEHQDVFEHGSDLSFVLSNTGCLL